MGGFVKLDVGLLDSTLWMDRDGRDVFLAALLMAQPHELTEPTTAQLEVDSLEPTGWEVPAGWYGLTAASGPGIVARARIEQEAGLAALRRLCAPEPQSRSQGFDGRRLARVDGGYLVLNYMKYRDKDYSAAERMRRLRARRKGVTPNSRNVRPNVTQADSREQIAESISKTTALAVADVIAELRALYTSDQLTILDAAIADFARTRKAGKIADSVVLAEYRWWERYPPEQVVAGLRTYVAKKYAAERKGENYARGIIRNTDPLDAGLSPGSPQGDGKPRGLRDSYMTPEDLRRLDEELAP